MLKTLKANKKQTLLAFTLCVLLISCGKRTPPVPPVERVPQRTEISAIQRGNRIILTWTTPARNAAGSSVLNIDRVDIYRLAEPLDAPLVLTEDDFSARSTLIATVDIGAADFGRKEMRFEDILSFAGQKARLRYAARYANKSGQKAAYSNFYLIEPTALVADVPRSTELLLSQDEIRVSWRAPGGNIDGSSPANILGYNVYRVEQGVSRRLNGAPVTDTSFSDRFFDFDKSYTYFVRAVSLGRDAAPVESLDSAKIDIAPKDTFAPAAPASITIAAAPGQISVFFAANVEADIAGYRVYRASDRELPLRDWTLLTPSPITTNTFQDPAVESGKTYFYYLTAIDRVGNVSSPSAIVGDTIP